MGFRVKTEPCPNCGFKNTGYYKFSPSSPVPAASIEGAYERRNIHMRITDIPINDMGCNTFCPKCGAEWMGSQHLSWMTGKEIEELISSDDLEIDMSIYKQQKRMFGGPFDYKRHLKKERKIAKKGKRIPFNPFRNK